MSIESSSPGFSPLLQTVCKWVIAVVVNGMLIALLYSAVSGRKSLELNQSLYEGHIFLGEPGSTEFQSREGRSWITYGPNGSIGPVHGTDDSFRILFIGDSMTAGVQVNDGERFADMVEIGWNANHPDNPIVTINGALGGTQSWNLLMSFFENIDEAFAPDLVVAGVQPVVLENLRKDSHAMNSLRKGIPSPITRPIPMSAVTRLKMFVNDVGLRSFFERCLLQARNLNEAAEPAAKSGGMGSPGITENSLGEATNLFVKVLADQWGDRLVVLCLQNENEIETEESSIVELRRALEAREVPAIEPYRQLHEAASSRRPTRGFSNSIINRGHYNQRGHRIVAESILEWLDTRL